MSRLIESTLTGKISKALLESADVDVEYVCHSDTDANNDNEYFTNEKEAIEYAKANPDTIDVVMKVDNNEGTEEVIWEKEKECDKFKEGKVELKESLYDEIADFMKDLDPYGYEDAYDGDEAEKHHKSCCPDKTSSNRQRHLPVSC